MWLNKRDKTRERKRQSWLNKRQKKIEPNGQQIGSDRVVLMRDRKRYRWIEWDTIFYSFLSYRQKMIKSDRISTFLFPVEITANRVIERDPMGSFIRLRVSNELAGYSYIAIAIHSLQTVQSVHLYLSVSTLCCTQYLCMLHTFECLSKVVAY